MITKNNTHLLMVLEAVQNLEEISGPDTLKEYAEILEAVRNEISSRITTAYARIENGES